MSSSEDIVVEEKKVSTKKRKTEAYKEKVKPFAVRNRHNTSMYEVYFEEGGQIPAALGGAYTSLSQNMHPCKS